MNWMKKAVVSAALCLATAGIASAAKDVKRDETYYQEQFSKWSASVAQLQNADETRAAVANIEEIRTLIGQAQALAAAEKIKQIKPTEEMITVKIRFASAYLERLAREAAAKDAQAQADAAEEAAQAAKAAADATKKRYDELEAKGL